MATIELKDITKEYRSDEIITPALKNISLKIGTGEFVAIDAGVRGIQHFYLRWHRLRQDNIIKHYRLHGRSYQWYIFA